MSELTGLWIPSEYLRNARLSRNELVIISYLKYRLDKGFFRGNHAEISQALKLKSPRVSESISALFQKGFLERTEGQKYYILSKKYLDLEGKKVTESVIIKEAATVAESVTLSYIEKDIKKDNNDDVENSQENENLKLKKSAKVFVKKISLPKVEFLDSEFKDFNVFEEHIRQAHPEIDTNFYYHKISTWIDKNTGTLAKRKIWKNTVQQFLENDYKKGELVTKKKSWKVNSQ